MSDFKNDISTLIQLKYDLDTALEFNDTDRAREILEKFKELYKKITGKTFEEGFSSEIKIRSIFNRDDQNDNPDSKELEEEIEM